MDKTRDAYFSFKKLKNSSEMLYNSWKSIVMQLPYAYQGRCMLTVIYALDASNATILDNEDAEEYQNKLKEISKSGTYKTFVTEKSMSAEIASPLIRNLYTGSVFMGLLSTLSHFYDTQKEIAGSTFGF